MTTFSKKYEPENFEQEIYKTWENGGYFKPKKTTSNNTFYIPLPPPNVTWVLHLWHALTLTLEDIMIRYHRMIWDETLWLPWTDHAWIATQAKVEKNLLSQKITRQSLWREKFLDEVWKWKDFSHKTITDQVKVIWSSLDWSREKFTLDPDLYKTVTDAFVDLYNKWYIYKWEYMVNYSPALDTVVSDQEVDYKEERGKLYYITYFVSWSDNEIIVATTRPETLLWDEAVAVHPKDKRYKALLKAWKKLILPILNKEIPIIGDEMVEMDFWTWAVKITPAHDPNDFEVWKRHSLSMDNIVIWKDWKMTSKAWIFQGQDFLTARENIVELLKSKWNLLKVEDYNHKVWYCNRSGCKIETIISTQWFVKVEEMTKKVISWYNKKEFEIVPNRFNKIFEDWIFNLRDWCISRQLWWWHRIPRYYHKTTWEMVVSSEDLTKTWEYYQDEDVLDTWFSSALWPFSTLWFDIPSKTWSEDFNKFYPASVLETWHDIIFFWVIRMLLFWYEFTDKTPFKQIYFHWLIKDKHGKKMSKSLWNGIDPLDMVEKYSSDALRLTLSIWNTPWNDLKFDEANVEENKIFLNKIWNASRFVYMSLFEKWDYKLDSIDKIEKRILDNFDDLNFFEKWILSRLSFVSREVNNWMEKLNFSESWILLKEFTKNEFCDYFIEEFKIMSKNSKYSFDIIIYVINHILRLWHPYAPFISEKLWGVLWFEGKLIESNFSRVPFEINKNIEKDKEVIIEIIKWIRNIRAENNVVPSNPIKVELKIKSSKKDLFWNEVLEVISWIVRSEQTQIVSKQSSDKLAYVVTKSWIEIFVDTSNAKDMEWEIERLKLQIDDTKEYIQILDKKLLNESFVRNAPANLVRWEEQKKQEALEKLKKLEEKLSEIS